MSAVTSLMCSPCASSKALEDRFVAEAMERFAMTEMDARDFWAKVSGWPEGPHPRTLLEAQQGLCPRHREAVARGVTELIRLGFTEPEAVSIMLDCLRSLQRR